MDREGMMPLPGKLVARIQESLLSAYPTEGDLAQMVRIELNESLHAIAGGANQSDRVFSLISWAESNGRVKQLIDAAVRRNPNNPDLVALAADRQLAAVLSGTAESEGAADKQRMRRLARNGRLKKPASTVVVLIGAVAIVIIAAISIVIQELVISRGLIVVSSEFHMHALTATPTPQATYTPQGLRDTNRDPSVHAVTAEPILRIPTHMATELPHRGIDPIDSSTGIVGQANQDGYQNAQMYYEIPTQLHNTFAKRWKKTSGCVR
jgi:ribosomal protein S16